MSGILKIVPDVDVSHFYEDGINTIWLNIQRCRLIWTIDIYDIFRIASHHAHCFPLATKSRFKNYDCHTAFLTVKCEVWEYKFNDTRNHEKNALLCCWNVTEGTRMHFFHIQVAQLLNILALTFIGRSQLLVIVRCRYKYHWHVENGSYPNYSLFYATLLILFFRKMCYTIFHDSRL